MFRILCRKSTPISYTHFIEHLPRILSSFLSTTTTDEITALLQSKCNLCPSTALSISTKNSKFRSPANPDSITKLVQIFKSFDFSLPKIASIITRQPRILSLDPDKNLKVMLQYLHSVGLHPDSISCVPSILLANLHKRIVPNVELLKSLLPNENEFNLTLKRGPGLLVRDLDKYLPSIVDALQKHNVGPNVISTFLVGLASQIERVNRSKLEAAFEAIKEMNISPFHSMFAHALVVLALMQKTEWDRKFDTYKQLGWSEDQVLTAFAGHPYCMALSDEKRISNARFFEEKMGWSADTLCINPVLLSFSLKKRIVPRYEIWRILESKGLVKGGKVSKRYFMLPQKEFSEKYIVKYRDQAPEVLTIFKSTTKDSGSRLKRLNAIQT